MTNPLAVGIIHFKLISHYIDTMTDLLMSIFSGNRNWILFWWYRFVNGSSGFLNLVWSLMKYCHHNLSTFVSDKIFKKNIDSSSTNNGLVKTIWNSIRNPNTAVISKQHSQLYNIFCNIYGQNLIQIMWSNHVYCNFFVDVEVIFKNTRNLIFIFSNVHEIFPRDEKKMKTIRSNNNLCKYYALRSMWYF